MLGPDARRGVRARRVLRGEHRRAVRTQRLRAAARRRRDPDPRRSTRRRSSTCWPVLAPRARAVARPRDDRRSGSPAAATPRSCSSVRRRRRKSCRRSCGPAASFGPRLAVLVHPSDPDAAPASSPHPARVSSDPGAPDPRPRRMGLSWSCPRPCDCESDGTHPGHTAPPPAPERARRDRARRDRGRLRLRADPVGHGATYRMIAVGVASGVHRLGDRAPRDAPGHARERRGLAARRHLARGPRTPRGTRCRRLTTVRSLGTLATLVGQQAREYVSPRRRRPPW